MSHSPSSAPLSSLARPDAGWRFSLFPDAHEGGGSFQASVRRVSTYVSRGYALDRNGQHPKQGDALGRNCAGTALPIG